MPPREESSSRQRPAAADFTCPTSYCRVEFIVVLPACPRGASR